MFKHGVDFLFVDSEGDADKIKAFFISQGKVEGYNEATVMNNIKHGINTEGGKNTFIVPKTGKYISLIYKKSDKYELMDALIHEIDYIVYNLGDWLDLRNRKLFVYIFGYIYISVIKQLHI